MTPTDDHKKDTQDWQPATLFEALLTVEDLGAVVDALNQWLDEVEIIEDDDPDGGQTGTGKHFTRGRKGV